MAKPGRKKNISKGHAPPTSPAVRSKKSRAKTKEIKLMQFYFRAEAMIINSIALHVLAGHLYDTPSGLRIDLQTDVGREAWFRLWERVFQDTEWAETGDPPPDGWIPPKWVSKSQ